MRILKKLISLAILLSVINLPVFATSSKYLSYTVSSEDFNQKKINKKYSKEIFKITNISQIPLKLVWSQQTNDVTGQHVYDTTQYITTVGSQCVAFLAGLTIIGMPFGIHGAVKMVQNKNEKLLNEINTYIKSGSVNWEAILQPNETIEIHLIKLRTETQPLVLKMRFTGNNGKILEEITMKQ